MSPEAKERGMDLEGRRIPDADEAHVAAVFHRRATPDNVGPAETPAAFYIHRHQYPLAKPPAFEKFPGGQKRIPIPSRRRFGTPYGSFHDLMLSPGCPKGKLANEKTEMHRLAQNV